MTTTGGLISWGGICATYLRFRQACKAQDVNLVPAAKSPLQPALAWYGLVWIVLLSMSMISKPS
jgi:yeast amino acid transporter